MANPDSNIVAVFKLHTVQNEARSKDENRPVFDEMEVVEIRFPGDRNRVSVFPAHDFTTQEVSDDGSTVNVTYAERFRDQYKRFKEQKTQVKEGTPLEELTFLTAAKRSELKALNIYTVETLASLDTAAIKALGMDGRNLVNQAQAYIEHARDTGASVRQAEEIAALKAELAALKKGKKSQTNDAEDFDSWSDDDLKAFIKAETGNAPRGNPSHQTLVSMASEVHAAKEAEAT